MSCCAPGVQWLRIAQSKGYLRLGAFLPDNRNRAVSKMSCVFKKFEDGKVPPPTKKLFP